MAKCPKCGHKLKIWNISQYCPACKTNMRFYNFEEEFIRSAKIAELNQAAFHVKMRRLKASFVGSKPVIARLVLCLLPVIMLLIPAGNFHLEMPYKSVDFSVGLLGIINLFMGSDLGVIIGMRASDFAGAEFSAACSALVSYMLPVLFAVAVLLSTLLAFISIKNMQKVICAFSALGVVSAIASQIVVYVKVAALKDTLFITGKSGFGLYAVIIGFAVVFVVNFIINKNGIPVDYDEGMIERTKIYKEYLAGKVNIDELPQPVVVTEETRKIEEQIRSEEEKARKAVQSK